MAQTDDIPIRIGFSDYRPDGQGTLETWLNKEAETAHGGEVPESNEAQGTAAYSDLYDDPPKRKDPTNVDGNWGKKEKPEGVKSPDPNHNNAGTYNAAQQERHLVAGRALDSLPSATTNAQELLSQNFEHARSGNFTTHSLLLESKTKEGSVRPTLSQRVRNLLDNF